jgi:hypothetical protein
LFHQGNVRDLFAQLEQAYIHRAKLWTDFQETIDKIGSAFSFFSTLFPVCLQMVTLTRIFLQADRAISDFKAIPTKFEQVIVKCEKEAKELDQSNTASAKGTEDMIKGLFSNL